MTTTNYNPDDWKLVQVIQPKEGTQVEPLFVYERREDGTADYTPSNKSNVGDVVYLPNTDGAVGG